MEEIVSSVVEFLKSLIINSNIYVSILTGLGVVILESILPVLPLALFIAINCLVFGNMFGFILSWVGTIIGCIISFYAFRKGFSKFLYRKIDSNKFGTEVMNDISNIKFTNLVLITALPFTPAFSINILCGLSKISFKKFLAAMLIAKISIVYFWGFIGTTFVESVGDIKVLIELAIMMLVMYVVSKVICKKFKIE